MKKFFSTISVLALLVTSLMAQESVVRNSNALDAKLTFAGPLQTEVNDTLFYGNTAKIYITAKGFVCGVNEYGDLGKYQRFDNTLPAKLMSVMMYIPQKRITGTNDNVNVVVKAVGTNGAPSTQLYTTTITTAQMITTDWTVVNIPSLNVTGPFFVGLEWAATINDTFGLACDAKGEGNGAKRSWEKWDNGAYYDIHTSWTSSGVPFDVDLFIAAVLDNNVPVELTSFSAACVDGKVNVTWKTATETNNSGFIVERKQNGEYITVGFIRGNGTSTNGHTYSFVDNTVKSGKYTYRLRQMDHDGTFEYSNAVEVDVKAGVSYRLDQNFPNPFNPATTIKFGLQADAFVSVKVFNLLGQEVANIFNGNMAAGANEVKFNAGNLESGIYLYQMTAKGVDGSNFTSTRKMMLIK